MVPELEDGRHEDSEEASQDMHVNTMKKKESELGQREYNETFGHRKEDVGTSFYRIGVVVN